MSDERIRALERAVGDHPADAASRLALARELGRVGRRDDAIAHVALVLRTEPASVEAVRTLDDLGSGPLAHDAPWPTSAGSNDRASRSPLPGARRGELVKRIRIGREGETAIALTASATTLYVATSARRLVALDARQGAPRWIRDFQTLVDAPVVGEGERLLAVADGHLQLIEGTKGETLWSVRTAEERPFCALASRGLALITCGALLDAHCVATGAPRWSFKASGAIDACPVVDASAIFVAGSQGAIHAVDFDGLEVSRLRVPRGRVSRLAIESPQALRVTATAGERVVEEMSYHVKRDGPKLVAKSLAGGERPRERAVHDSGGCVYAIDSAGVHWFDSTGVLIKTVLPHANDVGPMAIGPDSTLVVASPRGILHVIA